MIIRGGLKNNGMKYGIHSNEPSLSTGSSWRKTLPSTTMGSSQRSHSNAQANRSWTSTSYSAVRDCTVLYCWIGFSLSLSAPRPHSGHGHLGHQVFVRVLFQRARFIGGYFGGADFGNPLAWVAPSDTSPPGRTQRRGGFHPFALSQVFPIRIVPPRATLMATPAPILAASGAQGCQRSLKKRNGSRQRPPFFCRGLVEL
jgi:hypothetical protein